MQSLYCEYYTALASVAVDYEEAVAKSKAFDLSMDCIANNLMPASPNISHHAAAFVLKTHDKKTRRKNK